MSQPIIKEKISVVRKGEVYRRKKPFGKKNAENQEQIIAIN